MLPQNKTFKCCITAGIYVDESTKQFSSLFVLCCSSNSSIFSDIRDLNITIFAVAFSSTQHIYISQLTVLCKANIHALVSF